MKNCVYCKRKLKKSAEIYSYFCDGGENSDLTHYFKPNVYLDFYFENYSIKINITEKGWEVHGSNFDYISTMKKFNIEEIKKIIKLYPLFK